MDLNNVIIQTLIGFLFFAYAGYFSWKSYDTKKRYREELEKFKSTHKNTEEFNDSKKWVIISSFMCGLSLFSAILAERIGSAQSQLVFYRIAYVAVAIMFVGLAIETNVKKRIWFCEDGFFLMDKYYRYRMITAINEKKTLFFFRNAEVVIAGKEPILVSGKMADQVKERQLKWKANKKQKKRR